MANESKPGRTQVEDLAISQQEMTEEELQKVKGGVGEGKHKFVLLPAEQHELKKMEAEDPPLRPM